MREPDPVIEALPYANFELLLFDFDLKKHLNWFWVYYLKTYFSVIISYILFLSQKYIP